MSDAVYGKLAEWKKSPLIFVHDCIEAEPSDQQAEALRLFNKSQRTTIRSGHGTGKDALASWLIIWFLATRAYAKIVCTAPTGRQLNDILWSELSKWIRKSKLQGEFVVQKDKIFQKDNPKEWWARAVSASVKATKEEQAETLAGFHGDHLLMVVDEASGVPDPVYIPLEGAMTQKDNKVLLIGNMTKNAGYFYDTHFHGFHSKNWTKIHWDSRESSNVEPSYPIYMAEKYGIDSNIFAIRVKGDPPFEDDKVLIPLSWSMQCVGNEIKEEDIPEEEPKYLGVDVARYGEDKSIILPRRANKIYPWEDFQGLNTITLAGHVKLTATEEEVDGTGVDTVGVGGPVYDYLYKDNMEGLRGVNVTHASSDIEKYDRLRDELWCMVREKCLHGLYDFPTLKRPHDTESLGEQLCNELAGPYYDFNKHGGIVVESKKKMKARGIISPNIADALGITEYFHRTASRIWKKKDPGKSRRKRTKDSLAMVPGCDRWAVR